MPDLGDLPLAGRGGWAPVRRLLGRGVDRLAEGAPGARVGMLDGQDLDAAGGLAEADLWGLVVPQLRVAIEADQQRGG